MKDKVNWYRPVSDWLNTPEPRMVAVSLVVIKLRSDLVNVKWVTECRGGAQYLQSKCEKLV